MHTNLRKKTIAPASVLESGKVKYMPVSRILPRDNNPRSHSARQINQIAQSIERFGFVNPVLVDRSHQIVCGHGRVEAAKLLGLRAVPVITLEHLSQDELRAYVITDNRLAEKAGWDHQILAIEFQALTELGFDLELTGFELPEIEVILDAEAQKTSTIEDDPLPDLVTNRVCTKPDDLWILGEHRLLCGDARQRGSFEALLQDDCAKMVFVDPPYNVPIRGHVSGKGRIKHREFAQASGEKTSAQFTKFLEECFGQLAEHSADGSIHFICTDWRHLDEMLTAGKRCYRELKNLVVWTKTNAGMGNFYRSQHELILVWKYGRGKHINNFGLGEHGRSRTNVWTYAGANAFGRDRLSDLEMHPTVKPVALVADAIRDCSHRGDLVLDCFGGSGTTLIACEKTRRKARVIELDPAYCDLIVRRWQKLTGKRAVHAETGVAFDATAKRKKTAGAA